MLENTIHAAAIPPHEVERGGADTAGGTDWPIVYRHRLPTRVWHWLNAGIILVMSGLMIFNAHPRLYQGEYKQAKYVTRVEAAAALSSIGGGRGGYWEDEVGYDWYAGV